MIKRDSAKDFAIFNTITEYEALYNKRSEDTPIVDDETICFISSEGTIYTHGIKFGGSSSSSEGTTYTAGTGINISNNQISVNTTWLDDRILSRINNINPGQDSTTIGLATDTTIGGFKTGYTNNGKNYKVQLDSDGRAFVNVPWSSAVINPDDPNSQYYDDLEERLNTLQGLIDGLRSDLNGIHQLSEDEIAHMLEDILSQREWLEQHVNFGELFHLSDWYDDLNAYLLTVGVLNEDGTGKWSSLITRLDEISAQVLTIQHSIGENGLIDLTILESNLKAYINDKIAGLDLATRYAVQDGNLDVIRWMTSGFRSQAGKQEGEEGYYVDFAQMYADAFDGVNNATAAVTTKVNFVKDKIDSAEALIGTSFNDWLAGVVTQSNKDSAVAALFAEDAESSSKAAIMATVKNDQSFLDLVADRVTIDADITAIRGYLEAGDATFKGTVKADNLYRNIQFCYQSMDNAQRTAVSYAKPLYLYTENLNDPDSIPEFVNGGLYTEEYINAVVNSGGLTPDGGTIARWYEVNGEKFHVCTGKSDIIILTANIYSDALGSDDECIILPDPEFNQGKLIEIYSGNNYSNEPNRPYFFKVSSVSGGNMLAGYYNWDENLQNYSQSDVVDWSACCLGEPYRFIATTAKINGVEKAVWVKLQVSNQLLTDVRDGVLCIHFTRETYLYFDGGKLRLHTPSFDKEVTLKDN